MSKYYIKKLSFQLALSSLSTRVRFRPYFYSGNVSEMFQSPVMIRHLSYSGLHFYLVPHPMCHQHSQRSSGHLFRKACRQTATVATSCSIWPHEILAFTTSAFPSFYSSYILAHLQVFTVQSHATQLTTLCADVVVWVPLPVSYFHFRLFLSWRRWGEGQMFLCRYFWGVMH